MSAFRKDHLPELDGLRGIAVLLVLWVHIPHHAFGSTCQAVLQAVQPGHVGVDLFFVLSGFLITRILLVDREQGVPLRNFLMRRLLRIFPIYYLSIVLLMPQLSAEEVVTLATYTSNYGFLAKDTMSVLEHTWSLAVEEHFYLLWPAAAVFLPPRRSRQVLLLGVLPLAVLTVIGALFVPWLVEDQRLFSEFVGRTSTARFFSLGLGALLAYHEGAWRDRRVRAVATVLLACTAAWTLSGAGARALGYDALLARIPGAGGDARRYGAALLTLFVPFATAAAVVFGVALSGPRTPQGVLLRSTPLRGVGRISYGLYLYHFPIFHLDVWGPGGDEAIEPARILAVLAVTFGTAALSFHWIERPLLAFGARFRGHERRAQAPMPAHEKARRWLLAGAAVLALGWLLRGGAAQLVDLFVGGLV